MEQKDYCFIKNGIVEAIYTSDLENASLTKERMGFDFFVERPNAFVGIGHFYEQQSGQFYFWAKEVDEDGVETGNTIKNYL